jgi:hypothetical protein
MHEGSVSTGRCKLEQQFPVTPIRPTIRITFCPLCRAVHGQLISFLASSSLVDCLKLMLVKEMIFSVLTTCTLFFLSRFEAALADDRSKCRYIPGDEGWPSEPQWKQLNSSIGGRLIATEPLASPCHQPGYDMQKCSFIREQWGFAPLQ